MNADELAPAADAQSDFDPGDFLPSKYRPLADDTEFEVLVTRPRMEYFVGHQDELQALLSKYGIKMELNVQKLLVYVRTTPETFDPCSVLVAKQFIKLLARYMDLSVA